MFVKNLKMNNKKIKSPFLSHNWPAYHLLHLAIDRLSQSTTSFWFWGHIDLVNLIRILFFRVNIAIDFILVIRTIYISMIFFFDVFIWLQTVLWVIIGLLYRAVWMDRHVETLLLCMLIEWFYIVINFAHLNTSSQIRRKLVVNLVSKSTSSLHVRPTIFTSAYWV